MWRDTFLFFPYVAIGLRLVTSGVEKSGGDESYPSFRCKFGGPSLLLCFWFSLRADVFKLVERPVGKTAASIPRRATHTPGYVKECGLGTLKFSLDLVILAYRAACLASVFLIHR